MCFSIVFYYAYVVNFLATSDEMYKSVGYLPEVKFLNSTRMTRM